LPGGLHNSTKELDGGRSGENVVEVPKNSDGPASSALGNRGTGEGCSPVLRMTRSVGEAAELGDRAANRAALLGLA
jgi:hypothetical protein